jgi:excinuclease ABC subunit A
MLAMHSEAIPRMGNPAPATTVATDVIRIRGARTHNLRGIDVDVPRDRLVVMTGVSGSGKSSLAFDTLFLEGQRRFLETLSPAVRQFLDRMRRPEVDEIDGLPPTLAVEQHAGSVRPRSTLATVTEIYDFLRLLYARAGTPHCWKCGRVLSQQSVQAIVDGILALEQGRKVMILAPLAHGRKGTHQELFDRIARDGFVRARVDGEIVDVSAPPQLKKSKAHDIDLIVDRIVVKEGLRARLHESVELAIKHGNGSCVVSHQEETGWHDQLFSSRFACPDCELSFLEIEPRTFSFNSPYGACPTCSGLGVITSAAQEPSARLALFAAVDVAPCPDCGGARIGPVGRAVTWAGIPIHELTAQTVAAAAEFFRKGADSAGGATPAVAALVAARIVPEITRRLEFLGRVGLDYLTLDRPTATLSGGELQRARLAGCLGSGLVGVCYVLDEPTIGLHPRDTQRLLNSLFELRDQGNSVVVVEHDGAIMQAADWLIDLGPGAGREGGLVVAQGTPAEVAANPESVTGDYLRRIGTMDAGRLAKPRVVEADASLVLSDVTARNLKGVTARFPLGKLVCVTGVSGSGKSTLVMETLVPLVRAQLNREPPSGSASLAGGALIDRLVEVDQSPIGRNARSTPATVSGLWDEIRRLFARTREARLRGFRSSRFSFNAPGGRCDECRGEGVRRVGVHFLPEVDLVCPVCRGARFNRQTLQIRFRGRSAADVLAMRVDEAAEFFENLAGLHHTLSTFRDVGLGYLTLGQSAATLSGGEAQRVKLATELSKSSPGRALYVLDEPTTGLHPADVERLLVLLNRLVDQGHTVIVVEHHLDVISSADWVIDLGPEGGRDGGRIVAEGTPGDIAAVAESYTGQALREYGIAPSDIGQ